MAGLHGWGSIARWLAPPPGRVAHASTVVAGEAEFRAIFEAASDGMLIADPDNGVVVEANPAACRMHAATRDQLIGSMAARLVEPEYREALAHMAPATLGGETVRERAVISRLDGTTAPVEITGTTVRFQGRTHVLSILRAVADEAAVGTQNLPLFEDVQRSAREYATLAGVAADLTLDRAVQATLTSIAETVCRGTGAVAASISLLDADSGRLEVGAGHGVPVGYFEAVVHLPLLRIQGRRQLFDEGRPVVVPDVASAAATVAEAAPLVEMLEAIGAQAAAFLPLIARGRTLGLLSVLYAEREGPPAGQVRFLSALANQVSAAVDNMRLFAVTEQSARESAALAAIAANMTLGQSLRTTLDTVATSVVAATTALSCTVSIADPETGTMAMVGGAGVPEGFVEAARSVADRSESQRNEAVLRGQPLVKHGVRAQLLADRAFEPLHAEIRAARWDTVVALPVSYGGQAVGALQVGYEGDREPSPSEWRLLSAIADQLSVAIENARLFMRAERRTHELSTLLEAARETGSMLDMDRLIRALLAHLRQVIPCAGISLATFDADGMVSILGQDSDFDVQGSLGITLRHGEGTAVGRRLYEGSPIIVRDLREDTEGSRTFRKKLTGANPAVLERTRSWMAVPLMSQARAIGALFFSDPAPGRFDERQANLALAFGAQASAAIENARLFAETNQRVAELEALSAIAESLTTVQPIETTLTNLARRVTESTHLVGCAVTLADAATGGLPFAVGHGLPEGYVDGVVAIYRDPGAREMAGFYYRDTAGLPYVVQKRARLLTERFYERVWPLLQEATFETVALIPIRYQGRFLGSLNGYFAEGSAPGEPDINLLRAIADQAAVAIESAGLLSEVTRRAREQEALAAVSTAFSYERPLGEALDLLAETIGEQTGAMGVIVRLMDETAAGGRRGSHGLPDGFVAALDQARRSNLVFWSHFERPDGPQVVNSLVDWVQEQPALAPILPFVPVFPAGCMVRVPSVYRDRTRVNIVLFLAAKESPAEHEIAFYQQIAERTSIVLDNARLVGEVRERTSEITALYRADEVLHRSLRLDDVLNALLEVAVELLGVHGAALQLWEPESAQPRLLTVGTTNERAAARVIANLEAGGREEFVRRARSRVQSLVAIAETTDNPGASQERTRNIGIRAIIETGILVGDEVFGMLDGFHLEPHAFSGSDCRIFEAVGRRAALAIENARLYERARARTEQLEALYRADEDLHRSLRLEDVFEALLQSVTDSLHLDRAVLITWEADVPRPTVRWSRPIPETFEQLMVDVLVGTGRQGFGEYLQRTAVEVIIAGDGDRKVEHENMDRLSVSTLIQVPLRANDAGYAFVGGVSFKPRQFSAEEVRLFSALVRRAEVAVENARLYEQAQSLAAIEERQRLARELHDSVSQALYGVALGSRTARTLLDRDPERAKEPVDYVLSLAEAGLAEMRALIFELRPESLEQEGLLAAIEKQVASTRARYGVAVDAVLEGEPEAPLPTKEALYRVTQEALHNVVKHARAENVRVFLGTAGGSVVLDLRDDGQGFDVTGDFPGHLGLKSMRERVTRAGGVFTIESVLGEGTHLRVEIPIADPGVVTG